MQDLDRILAPYRGFRPTRPADARVTTIGLGNRPAAPTLDLLPQAS